MSVRVRPRVPSVFGETDIIFVFETKVVGSIPARPANYKLLIHRRAKLTLVKYFISKYVTSYRSKTAI